MASWSRAHVLKAAFLLCVLLLLLLNFSNFRNPKSDANHVLSKFSFARQPSSEALPMFSPMRPHSERVVATGASTSGNNNNNSAHRNSIGTASVAGSASASRANDNNDSNRSATNLNNISHPFVLSKHMQINSINATTVSGKFSAIVATNATTQLISNNSNGSSSVINSIDAKAILVGGGDSNSIEQITTNFVFSNESRSGIAPTIFAITNETDTVGLLDASNKTRLSVDESSTNTFLSKLMTKFGLNACPLIPPNLNGPIDIDIEYESLESIEAKFRDRLLPGGWYKPTECNAKDRVAIVIPYRDRANHLPIFLKNIHPLLMKQQIEYGIFVIEQIADGMFNRAALMNIGFLEALKLHQWDCFIFHDIDLIPMDDRNLYTCPDQPRHMSVAVDTMGFKLPYSGIFGGVSAMTVKQFKTVNGFSNSFWGWGGEDDDMSNRLKHVGYHIARYPVNIARYTMLSHRKEKANPKRYEKLVNGVKKFETEGLNSLKYKIHYFERKILYTWILVEIKQDSLMNVLASFFTKLK